MKYAVLKALNIRKGEEVSILLLLIYSFFIGAAIAFFVASSTSIFLMKFEKDMLPYAYIAGGLMVYILGHFYSNIQKKYEFSKILTFLISFLLLSVAFITFSYIFSGNKWTSFLLFIWIRVFVFINGVSFWAIASKIYDLRQGKRLFGLISTGEVISSVLGFFSIPLLLKYITTDDLLYFPIIALVICLFIMFIIVKKFNIQLAIKIAPKTIIKSTKNKLSDFLKNKYFLYVFLLALFPIFGLIFIDYIFNSQAKVEFPEKNVLTGFLGIFFGISAVIELILKIFVSGRLISKYGIKLGLTTLPIILIFCFILASVSGTLYGTTAMFFSFIVLARLFIRIVRTSINDPAFQILFQPLVPEERLAFQSKIEGGPKAMGNVFAGVLLLILTALGTLSLTHLSYIFIIILIFWTQSGFKMYREYRNTLKNILEKHKDKRQAKKQDKIKQDILSEQLAENDTENFIFTNNLLEKIAPAQIDVLIQNLLHKSTPEIKKEIIKLLKTKKLVISLKDIDDYILNSESEIQKKLLEEIQNILEEIDDIPLEKMLELSKSESPKEREYAAKLLGQSGRYNAFKILIDLLHDEESSVVKEALIASGKIKRFELWSYIIDNLSSSTYNNTAVSAIKMIGAPILKDLEIYFYKMGNNTQIQIQIVRLITRIGGEKAIELLKDKINFLDKDVRHEILLSLSKLEYDATIQEIPFIKQAIEEEISFTVWTMAALIDIGENDEYISLRKTLEFELAKKKKNVFLLISLLYDSKTIEHILENIESGDSDSIIYALELTDMTVSEDIKEMLIPLIDDLTINECVNNFDILFPQEKLSVLERLKDIINKDYAKVNKWTKACAIELLNNFDNKHTSEILSANIINSDFTIMETSAYTLNNVNPEKYLDIIVNFNKSDLNRLKPITDKLKKTKKEDFLLITDKVKLLKQTNLFKDIAEEHLAELAVCFNEIVLETKESLSKKSVIDNYLYVIASGGINSKTNSKTIRTYTIMEAFLIIFELDSAQTDLEYVATEKTRLLQIDINDLDDLELITDDADIIKKIIYLLNTQ